MSEYWGRGSELDKYGGGGKKRDGKEGWESRIEVGRHGIISAGEGEGSMGGVEKC